MQRLILTLALALALAVPAAAVVNDDGRPPVKEWTVAVFLNADNNLDPFGVEDQEEMARVGSNDWLNIVSLIDRESGPAVLNYIEKGNIKKVKDMGELDMGDYRVFVSFMKMIAKDYPARHYLVTIWNHGSGWKHAGSGIVRGISYDDSSGNHITTEQLGIALGQVKTALGKNIDILNFDACLMQMMEVVHACRSTCDYVLASEETEPGKGAPYDDVLRTLSKTSTPEGFTKSWTRAFCASYNNGSQGYEACTQSSIKTAAFGALHDATDGLAKALMAGKFAPHITAALGRVQSFAEPAHVDLVHLTELLKSSINETGVQTACTKLLQAANAAIVANGNVSASMKNAKGVAIFFPAQSYSFDSDYLKLGWAKESLWDEFLKDYYAKRTADDVVSAIDNGDVSVLQEFVNKADPATDRALIKFVAQEVNFRVHSEGGLPESLVTQVKALIAELLAK